MRTTTFVPMVAGQLQDHLGTRTVHMEHQTHHFLTPRLAGLYVVQSHIKGMLVSCHRSASCECKGA